MKDILVTLATLVLAVSALKIDGICNKAPSIDAASFSLEADVDAATGLYLSMTVVMEITGKYAMIPAISDWK